MDFLALDENLIENAKAKKIYEFVEREIKVLFFLNYLKKFKVGEGKFEGCNEKLNEGGVICKEKEKEGENFKENCEIYKKLFVG